MWFLEKILGLLPNRDLSRPHEPIVSLANPKKIDYLINDPTTPKLRAEVSPANMTILKYRVQGLTSGDQQANNCHVTVANGVHATQQAGRSIGRWASGRPLNVLPKAKKGLNAYYNRRSLVFFFGQDPKTNRTVYTADSSDIVAHELGHALLDAQRPDFWSTQAPEVWAFHEAYGDITAMFHIMQYDEALKHALKETEGDLRKPNVISRLAEEMGNAIFHVTGGRDGRKSGALRNATNEFKYAPPNKLPKNAPDNKLASECHSYGRVFLGTWYDILVEFYEYEKGEKVQPVEALKKARDRAFKYLRQAIHLAPRVPRYHQALAQSMLLGAEQPYKKIMNNIFRSRRILKRQIKMLSKTDMEVSEILSAAEHIERVESGTAVRIASNKTIKLADHIPEGFVSNMSVGDYDLADLEIEVANESYYEFDKRGKLVAENTASMEQIVNDARLCALMIQNEDSIGPGKDKMWKVKKGKLVRTFIE